MHQTIVTQWQLFLQCDHHINLPCDAVIVLIVIVIIFYAIKYRTRTYNLLLPSTWWGSRYVIRIININVIQ